MFLGRYAMQCVAGRLQADRFVVQARWFAVAAGRYAMRAVRFVMFLQWFLVQLERFLVLAGWHAMSVERFAMSGRYLLMADWLLIVQGGPGMAPTTMHAVRGAGRVGAGRSARAARGEIAQQHLTMRHPFLVSASFSLETHRYGQYHFRRETRASDRQTHFS